jgi:hypothetical protein
MQEAQPVVPTEAPPSFGEGGSGLTPDSADVGNGVMDPRALTILTTEHWNLLTARSLVYNEAFARAGMFLAFLSATLVVLGLISTATGFSDAFLAVASVVLALDLFVGLASLGRIAAASGEDLRYLQGMNRLRHAYLEIVPGLERYFITSQYDDFASVAAFYGPAGAGALRGVAHGLTTTPGMIGAICSAVAGGLSASISLLATHDPMLGAVIGIATSLAFFAFINAVVIWRVRAFMRSMTAQFPPPDPEKPPTD